MSSNRMPTFVPRDGTEGHCGENTQSPFSESGQLEAPFMNYMRNEELIADGYEVVRGGAKLITNKILATALGRDPRYADRIGDGLNRVAERFIHFDWIIPILRHPVAGPPLLGFFCKIAGYHMPQPRMPVTDAERLKKLIRKCEENGVAGAAILNDAAKDMDLDVGTFKR